MSEETRVEKKGSRTELLLLILIFAAPVLGAWLVYNYTDIGRGESSSYGDLIDPPLPISQLSLYSPEEGVIAGELHGKWSLIYLSPKLCEDGCQQKIAMIQRLRSSLANNSDRLQLIVAINRNPEELDDAIEPSGFSWSRVLILSYADFYRSVLNAKEYVIQGSGEFLLVDPAGNLMMRYNADAEGAGVLQDIKKLLRYSRIG